MWAVIEFICGWPLVDEDVKNNMIWKNVNAILLKTQEAHVSFCELK